MEQHLNVLAVLYIVFGFIGLIIAFLVFALIVGGGLLSGDAEAIAVTSIIGTVFAFFLAMTSLPGIVGGFGLLKKKSWARILIIILGCLNLLNFPLGTCLGVYTLWVLLNKDSEGLFSGKTAV